MAPFLLRQPYTLRVLELDMRSIGGAIVSVVLAAGLHGMSLAADGSAHGGQVSAPPKVSQRLAIEPGEPAPKSDMITDLRPDGDTSRKSTSAGKSWLKPLSVTDTLCTTPVSPVTVIFDG